MFSWKFNSHADSVGVSGGMLFSNFVCIMLSRFQTSTFALHVCDGLFSLNSKYCRFDHLAQIIRQGKVNELVYVADTSWYRWRSL